MELPVLVDHEALGHEFLESVVVFTMITFGNFVKEQLAI